MKIAEISSSIDKQLSDRHWGIRAKGNSPGKHPRYYIMDYRGLALATGIIRYAYHKNKPGTQIFYRGQRRDWELWTSLYRNCSNKTETEEADLWLRDALKSITTAFDPEGTDDEREALAQHYGLKTRFLDVVDNVQSALWFAYDHIETDDPHFDDSVGYIQAIAVPSADFTVIDLRNKPSEWLRPHVQQGFAIKRNVPNAELGKISKYLVATFIISRENLRLWSNYDNLPHDYFYPSAAVDKGMTHWEKANSKLKSDGIEIFPPKQLEPHSSEE